MGNDKSKDIQTVGISRCSLPSLRGRGGLGVRFLLIFLLLINFGIKGYWKMKPYSFGSELKEVRETCHKKGFSEDYCILVDFSRPSGED